MFVYEERPTSHPGKGRYWKIDVSKGTGNKRNRKRKLGPSGGRRDGDDDGEEEEDVYDDDDDDEASSKDQIRAKPYGAQRFESNAGIPVFAYPEGTSFDPSRGVTQPPTMPSLSVTGSQGMNYMLGPNFPSQDNFQASSTLFRGTFPNMNSAQLGSRLTMRSFPSTGPPYSSLPPPGPHRAMSLPPQRHVYHPAPHVEIPRRHTTEGSAAMGRHHHQHPYGSGGIMSHPPIPDGALMQQGSSQPPQNRSPRRGASDLSSPNAGGQETSRKRRLR